jgi:hypothetical protein
LEELHVNFDEIPDELAQLIEQFGRTEEGLKATRLYIMQLERFEPQSTLLPKLYIAEKGWKKDRQELIQEAAKKWGWTEGKLRGFE